ncbi:hypothetical protein HWV62_9243 [Athelia sp. TMB]|nr:hypothetical protein HWV62_9243 [Athelia sp. TMB]
MSTHVFGEDARPYARMDLHRKISEMSQRIRELEDALALLQSSISIDTHALLREELLSIKNPSERRSSAEPDVPGDSLAEPVDAFGTLTIGESGEPVYFGPSAGSEAESKPEENRSTQQAMPELLNSLADMFPLGSPCPTSAETFEHAMIMLFSCLPPKPRALSLCDVFLEQASWLIRPLQRDELIEEILDPVYMAKQDRENPLCVVDTKVSPHKISALFSIFAMGALVDLTQPAFSGEGERYHHCARAALALRSIFNSPMIETVQALLLMSYYCSNDTQRYTRDSVWMLTSHGCKVAQSVSERYAWISLLLLILLKDRHAYVINLPRWTDAHSSGPQIETLLDGTWMPREQSDAELFSGKFTRQICFMCEAYYFLRPPVFSTGFQSLALGRPPSIGLSYVDCALPHVEAQTDPEAQFWKWKYQFNKNVFGTVLELTLGAKSPEYKIILELDRKVRDMPVPPALNIFRRTINPDEMSLNVVMKSGWLAIIRSITLLYIHKSYFARALIEEPANPLRSPYATSFLAAARCSSAVIRISSGHITTYPKLCMRWWTLWAHLFSAAVVAGLIVTKAPASSMAPAAFTELTIAVALFESCAELSQRVKIGMNILHRLQKKATTLMAQYHNGIELPVAPSQIMQTQDNDVDDLAIFSGQAGDLFSRIISQRSHSHQAEVAGGLSPELPVTPAASDGLASQSPDSGYQDPMAMPDVHPSLLEYISLHAATKPSGYSGNTDTDLLGLSETFDPITVKMTSEASQFSLDPSTPGFSSFHAPLESSLELGQSQNPSGNLSQASTFFDPFKQISAETFATDSWDMGGISGLGVTSSDSRGDEDWMLFMKESGLV